MRHPTHHAIFLTSFLTFAPAARADGLVAERFSPAVTGGGYITVERPDTMGHLSFQVGLLSTYAGESLRLVSGSTATPVIDGSLGATLAASLGLTRFLETGFSLPAVLYQNGPGITVPVALGDLQLHLKVRALSLQHFGLGLMGSLSLPTATGGTAAYAGLGQVAFTPRLLLEGRGRYFRAAINVGALLRSSAQEGDMTLSHELTYGLALGVRPLRLLELIGEVRGSTPLLSPFATVDQSPAEAVGGVAVHIKNFVATAGGGAGIVNGYGAPAWRVVAALRYERPPPDTRPRTEALVNAAPDPHPAQAAHPAPAPARTPSAPDENAQGPGPAASEPLHEIAVAVTDSQVIPAEAIYFDLNHARVHRRFAHVLDVTAQALLQHPELGLIRIEGHTDATGPLEWNRLLSRLRAQTVRRALIQRGVPAERLEVVGHGPKQPVADNHSETGRSRNRRVVFYHNHEDAGLNTAQRKGPSTN